MSVLKAFNNHFVEFWNDILHVFPNDINIKTAQVFIVNINKVNPALVIKCWYEYVVKPYASNIKNGDFDFFIKKDYIDDLGTSSQYDAPQLLKIIKELKHKAGCMGEHNHAKIIKYIQNLTKLCYLYFNISI